MSDVEPSLPANALRRRALTTDGTTLTTDGNENAFVFCSVVYTLFCAYWWIYTL